MKRIWIILFLVFAFCLNADIIEQSYRFDEHKISQREGYDSILFENTQLAGEAGNPALPYHAVSLLLPAGQIAESIEIIRNDEEILSGNYDLYPMQQSRPVSLGESGLFIRNENVYNSDQVFPSQPNGHLTTQFMNGYSIALCSFTPVSYIPSSGKVSYFQEVNVKITTSLDPDYSLSQKNLKTTPNILHKIDDFVQNPEMRLNYSPTENTREGEYDILLITSSDFQNDFDEWIELNLQKGMKTEIVTTADIYSSMTGVDEPEKIRNYIIQEYQDNEVSFVLLAGDAEVVPYRGLYCYVDSGNGYEDYNIPADLYYSSLDGTWDDDNDGIWGEIGEDDLLPDIAVARLPFSYIAELENMLFKTISYQTDPVLGELTSPLLAGEHMYSDPLTWGGDYLDLLIGYQNIDGYETTGIPDDDDFVKMYDRDMGTWTESQLIAEINIGHPFIYHGGHCNYSYCMRMDDWQITNYNFSGVNGIDHNFPLIYTHGCNSGGFDVDDCIAEYMLRIENFAAVYIGSSRYGWFNEGQTEGPSSHLNREFVDALYTNKTDFVAQTHLESKVDTSPWVTAPGQHEEGAIRWVFYGCNVLGDPTLPIWTTEPLEIVTTYDPNIYLGVDFIELQITGNGTAAEGLQCTLIQEGEFIGTAPTDASGTALIEFVPTSINPGEIELYVSGNNCMITNYTLEVIPAGTFVTVGEYSVFSGNDEDLEFGENAFLSLTLSEIGTSGDAHNVVVDITSYDDFITLNDDSEIVGTISSGNSVDLTDAFDFDISNDIPNEHEFTLDVLISSNEGSWQSELNFTAFAADIQLESVMIDDGDNGILDPGETVVLEVELSNEGGADVYDVLLDLQTINPYVTLEMLPLQIDSINAAGSVVFEICSITLDENTPLGENLEFILDLTADSGYVSQIEFNLFTGLIIESFESADFNEFEWTFSGSEYWQIDTAAYDGTYSARSGIITHNNHSSIHIQLNVLEESEISFWKKVSSEPDYDYLRFYIDGQLINEWSGDVDWSEESYIVTSGAHIFKWTYFKDQGVSTGDDCAWIDFIKFPDVDLYVSSDENIPPVATNLHDNYPNPFNPSTTIKFTLNQTEHVKIHVYNVKGQRVITLLDDVKLAGTHQVEWNGKDSNQKPVSSGIYFFEMGLDNRDYTSIKKMILLK